MSSDARYLIRCPNCGRLTILGNYCMYCGADLSVYRILEEARKLKKESESIYKELLNALERAKRCVKQQDEFKNKLPKEMERISEELDRINKEEVEIIRKAEKGEVELKEYLIRLNSLKVRKEVLSKIQNELKEISEELSEYRKLLARFIEYLTKEGNA